MITFMIHLIITIRVQQRDQGREVREKNGESGQSAKKE